MYKQCTSIIDPRFTTQFVPALIASGVLVEVKLRSNHTAVCTNNIRFDQVTAIRIGYVPGTFGGSWRSWSHSHTMYDVPAEAAVSGKSRIFWNTQVRTSSTYFDFQGVGSQSLLCAPPGRGKCWMQKAKNMWPHSMVSTVQAGSHYSSTGK
jgi:hypothetical protein